jgi:hypothetical protein
VLQCVDPKPLIDGHRFVSAKPDIHLNASIAQSLYALAIDGGERVRNGYDHAASLFNHQSVCTWWRFADVSTRF